MAARKLTGGCCGVRAVWGEDEDGAVEPQRRDEHREMKSMRVVTEGRASVGKWWHGKFMDCGTCGRRVQLEPGDEADSVLKIAFRPYEVVMECPNCGDSVRLINEARLNSVPEEW